MTISVYDKEDRKLGDFPTLPQAMAFIANDANVEPSKLRVGAPYDYSVDVHAGDDVYRLENLPPKPVNTLEPWKTR